MPKPWFLNPPTIRILEFNDKSLAFSIAGIDIVGLLPPTLGGVRFVLLATDYFTKWAQASAY